MRCCRTGSAISRAVARAEPPPVTMFAVAEVKIEATVNDGVMTIALPKLEVKPKSRIAIK